MEFSLGYHGVEYEKCQKIVFFKEGLGVGKLVWFKCYFSVIFQ